MSDAELAAHLAETTGRILPEVRASGVFSAKALGKAGDATVNQFLVRALCEARPDDRLLSEEMKCDGTRLAQSRLWIVDPVDGTREQGGSTAARCGTIGRMFTCRICLSARVSWHRECRRW